MPVITPTNGGSSSGGGVPAAWTATDNDLSIPVLKLGGGTVAAPYSIADSEVGIVANRASGFQGAFEVFDLGKPGVGYAIATVTAANGDTLVWGTDITLILLADVSDDAATWISVYGTTSAQPGVMFLTGFAAIPNPVGTFSQYVLFTPRAIRFSVGIVDNGTGLIYAGAQNPTVTYNFGYTAG